MRTCSYLDSRQRERCTECGAGLDLCQCVVPDDLAHERLTSAEGRFLLAVMDALDEKPTLNNGFEGLVSNVGQLGDKLVLHNVTRTPSPDQIFRQLVTIAALAARLATEGTPEYAYPET